MEYYRTFDVNVIIIDSSEIPYREELPENFSYYHRPELTFADKVLFGLTKVNTDLLCMSADDDFLIESSLVNAEHAMCNDRNISLSFGSFISFDELTHKKLHYLPMLNIDKKFFSITSNNKRQKIRRFMKNYDQVLWSMYRKDTLKLAFDLIKSCKFKNDNFIEICVATTAIYIGDLNIVSDKWGFREQSIGEHWGLRHGAISNNDKSDINKFIEHASKMSNRDYATDAIYFYTKYSFFRKLKSKIINIFQNYFISKSKLNHLTLSVKDYL